MPDRTPALPIAKRRRDIASTPTTPVCGGRQVADSQDVSLDQAATPAQLR